MASLRDLGLTEYEQRTYRALLRTGPTTARELSTVANVPMGRIYDVLDSLEATDIVRSQTASRPKRYMAVEPEAALERLLQAKQRDLEAALEQYEATVEELAGELDAPKGMDKAFWTAALGHDEAIDLLLERLSTAEQRIVMIADNRSPQFDLDRIGDPVIDRLETAVEDDVDVLVLLTRNVVSSLPASVGERYRDRLSDHPRFAVRTTENIHGTVNLIDDIEVVIQTANPLRPEEVFAVIDVKDSTFAAKLDGEFQSTWREAKPLSF